MADKQEKSWDNLIEEILKFRDERDWARFHTPKNLSAAIAIESAELQERFLWKTDTEVAADLRKASEKKKIVQEVADILIYTLLFARHLNADIDGAVRAKIRSNRKRYPIARSKGVATKYTEL